MSSTLDCITINFDSQQKYKETDSRVMRWSLIALFLLPLFANQINCHHVASNHEVHPYKYNPYSYGYDIEDNYGNKQWRQERSHNSQEVHGSYGYRDNLGIYREVTYVADKNGFRANIKTNEPSLSGSKDPAGVKLESYHSPTYERPQVHTKHNLSPGYNYNNHKV